LLTVNHDAAERCFVAALDQAFRANAVFKEWATSWIRRILHSIPALGDRLGRPKSIARSDAAPSCEAVVKGKLWFCATEGQTITVSRYD
jgi:hypothetical protein